MAEVQLALLAAEAREAIDNEDLARAADACRGAILRYPRWVEGYWLLGHILVESGYVSQARSCFEAVASAMPDDPRAYQGLADAAEQQHDVATAVAGLLRAVEVGESNQSVLLELRRLQQQAGYEVENTFTNARVAHARLVAGQYEEADVAAERALQDEPERLDLLVVQAVARLFGGDRGGSEKTCRRLLDLSPDCLKALAILRFLVPAEETAAMVADLDALDPEGQTLVWLRGQMTTLGYDADDLPATPRLVTWQEDEQAGRDGTRDLRPLDRLIPELEEVWPQWLQQAAQATPEARAGEPPAPPEGAPPPPSFAQEETPPSTPSFLGDVDTLAREFEVAMRPAPVGDQPDAVSTVPDAPSEVPTAAEPDRQAEAPAAEPAAPDAGRVAEASDWQIPTPNEQAPDAEAAPTTVETPVPPAAPAAANPADEFAQWQTPAAAPVGAATAPSHEQWNPESTAPPTEANVPAATAEAAWPVQEPPAAEPAAVPAAAETVDQPAEHAWNLDEARAERTDIAPAAIGVEGEQDIATLRIAARAAIAAGDHWAAIAQYGAVLAKMRATSEG